MSVNRGVPQPAKAMPPSYPMEPVNMGVDLYEPHTDPEKSESGLARRAPFQYGNWVLHPSYCGALPFIYDTVTSHLFGRSHNELAPTWAPDKILRLLAQYSQTAADMRWLHCLRVVGTTTETLMNPTVIVLDFMHPLKTHVERRKMLASVFPQLGIRQRPASDDVYLIPEFPETVCVDLWAGLHIMNDDWKMMVYDGIIAKDAGSRYFTQMDDYRIPSMRWHMHKFTNPLNINEVKAR